MTLFRVAGRVGGRTSVSSAALTRLIIVIALLAVACGESPTKTASATPSQLASGASASPGESSGPVPAVTPWPGNAVLGIEALGAADQPILAAINDLGRGIATEDLGLIRRAADGLAGLDVLLPNLDRINIYEPMRSFSDRYGAAIGGIVTAAKAARSAIDAKDADAIAATTNALIKSLGAYTDVQPELASWVEQSIRQRRLLVQ